MGGGEEKSWGRTGGHMFQLEDGRKPDFSLYLKGGVEFLSLLPPRPTFGERVIQDTKHSSVQIKGPFVYRRAAAAAFRQAETETGMGEREGGGGNGGKKMNKSERRKIGGERGGENSFFFKQCDEQELHELWACVAQNVNWTNESIPAVYFSDVVARPHSPG